MVDVTNQRTDAVDASVVNVLQSNLFSVGRNSDSGEQQSNNFPCDINETIELGKSCMVRSAIVCQKTFV